MILLLSYLLRASVSSILINEMSAWNTQSKGMLPEDLLKYISISVNDVLQCPEIVALNCPKTDGFTVQK